MKKIHQLQLVHLDIKGDNVCIPLGPASFDSDAPGERLHPLFGQLTLIDFAFALVSGEALTQPLPIGWQREYDYQSPRLLKALEEGRNGDLQLTRQLDWRCDMYSLAAMLKRYLPEEGAVRQSATTGWAAERYDAAKSLILALREHHDRDAPQSHPHAALINTTGARLREKDLASSLASGWTLARDVDVIPASASPLTPMTRLAPSIRVFVSPHERVSNDSHIAAVASRDKLAPLIIPPRDDSARPAARRAAGVAGRLADAGVVARRLARRHGSCAHLGHLGRHDVAAQRVDGTVGGRRETESRAGDAERDADSGGRCGARIYYDAIQHGERTTSREFRCSRSARDSAGLRSDCDARKRAAGRIAFARAHDTEKSGGPNEDREHKRQESHREFGCSARRAIIKADGGQ